MKKIFEKNGAKIIFAAIIVIFALLVMFNENKTKDNNENIENSEEIVSWNEKTHEDNNVVTVMALSTCGYCKQYHPIINELQEQYGFTLYWFEIDTLSEDDYKTLSTTYDLKNYEGSVPYTFITKNGEFLVDNIGALDEAATLEFLKTNKVIQE